MKENMCNKNNKTKNQIIQVYSRRVISNKILHKVPRYLPNSIQSYRKTKHKNLH